jgi:hypothetical protein
VKKSELKQIIKEEIQKVLNEDSIQTLKSKAQHRINIAKQKYFNKRDWGGIDDYDIVIKKLQTIDDPKTIELLVRWYEGDPNIKVPLDKIK